ncbi:MAG TPA: ABC transporter permease, partial [Anaerolineaceae bacterium]|nr:ABC transporter permease [Anaerolineaceae bacterium]
MGRFIARRILYMFAVILVVSAITFGLMHAVPGGPFDREKSLPPEIVANLEKRYHLDEPLVMQYGRYLFDVFIPKVTTAPPSLSLEDDHLVNVKLGPVWLKWGNFGPTFASRSRTVNDIFRQNLPISFQLGVLALVVALIIGAPLGVMAALKQNTIFDYLGMSVAIFGVSVPVIVLGPLLIWIFGVTLRWFPPTGWGAKPPYLLGFLPTKFGWDFWQF